MYPRLPNTLYAPPKVELLTRLDRQDLHSKCGIARGFPGCVVALIEASGDLHQIVDVAFLLVGQALT